MSIRYEIGGYEVVFTPWHSEYLAEDFMGVSVRNFDHTLDLIEKNWGSLQLYLEEQMEIGPEECARLQERYLA